MRAGVDDRLVHVIMRQMIVRCVATKSKLQNSHSRETKFRAQTLNIRGNDAEILCDDGQIAKCFFQRAE